MNNMYIYKYPRYKVTCDMAIEHQGKLLIIKRGPGLEAGKWAFPGGNLDPNETCIECACREVYEEVGYQYNPGYCGFKLVGIFDRPDRAEGDRAISILYFSPYNMHEEFKDWSPSEVKLGDDAVDYKWIAADEIGGIDWAFDCKEMAEKAFALCESYTRD